MHSPPFASSMVPLHTGAKILSAARIRIAARQESAPKTKMQHMLDVVICFCPYFAAIIMFLVYYLMPDAVQNFNPHVFTIVVCFFFGIISDHGSERITE